jgi:hypothetical protein
VVACGTTVLQPSLFSWFIGVCISDIHLPHVQKCAMLNNERIRTMMASQIVAHTYDAEDVKSYKANTNIT